MQPEDWDSGFGRAIGVFLNGQGIRERDRRGEPITDKHFIVLFNAGDDAVDFVIPDVKYSPEWDVLVDTAGVLANTDPVQPGATLSLEGKSLVVLCEHALPEPEIDHSVAASLTFQAGTISPDDVPAPAPKPEL
jgi:glycogen operon protein